MSGRGGTSGARGRRPTEPTGDGSHERASRGRLVVHAHFHQPPREDPFTDAVPVEPSAAPYHDWNARIAADCYGPNATRGSFGRISFDVGAPLARWLAREEPATHGAIVAGDAGRPGGNAMAIPYHHTILPLASLDERRTEIRWGLRSFELRFGRKATGMWLPETAVDLATLRLLADEGVTCTILAPWQSGEHHVETRRPYRAELGRGREMDIVFYDGGISGSLSFDPSVTSDAGRFAREVVAPRLQGTPFADGTRGLVVLATDGELYGHHQAFRDLFLEHLVGPASPNQAFDVVGLTEALAATPRPFPVTRIRERTSWSCHHGVARWGWECPDAPDGRWKAPLRAALTRLASGIDAVVAARFVAAAVPYRPTRDAYVEVVDGAVTPAAFGERWLAAAAAADREALLELLEAVRWRLAMFASDAWFWDDPVRLETKAALRAATRAARLVDGRAGTRLEAALVEDLSLFTSPATHMDGAAIRRVALEEIGQAP